MLQERWASDSPPIERQAQARKNNRSGKTGKMGKEWVQVITKDLIRNLVVPNEDPSGQSLVLPRDQFYRILQASRVLTEAEKEAELERAKQEKMATMQAAAERKNQMKHLDLARVKNAALSDLELEAKEKAEHLLARANAMRLEQEDEIKHLNEMILNAKCHAIRDAQILEKGQIAKELVTEEKRLDNMMEVDRQAAIRIQEEIERQRRDEQLMGAAKLMEQIHENEQERLFELERKDQENIQMQRYVEKLMGEDQAAVEKKHSEQIQLREDLNKANREILRRKNMKMEQEKMEEQKVLEYQRKKAPAYEREQERIRIEKEKETAKLRALQERAKDEQAIRDALRAKRAQEQTEREWRAKEAAEARKKAGDGGHGPEGTGREGKDERSRRCARSVWPTPTMSVLRSARKSKSVLLTATTSSEEGVKLDEEARARRARLDEVKRKKLGELREAGIPDKYLAGVERKVNQPQHAIA
nr:hypothetical protein BaRGS_014904 [Batillaria attramentaria]